MLKRQITKIRPTLKDVHNGASLWMCIIGGLLMILSGASGALGYLPEIQEGVRAFHGESFTISLDIIIGILSTLTAIGGCVVILGGLILTTSHVEAGRITVMVAMGMGSLSLIMSLVQLVLAGLLILPLLTQLAQSFGWIGAMMAILARNISEQQPIIPKH
ncbi:MAG: hypothetical protein P1Q69_16140 [Candidatus Thorarchaeota archaeon]|nr:hypothetical protein [Candidatus Thorarchaeota archaeon]